MAVSPERRAEILALLEKAMGITPKPPAKPKVVTSDAKVIRDALVRVGPADPNYPRSDDGVVRVRALNFVTIDMAAYEAQQEAKREDRRRRREIDPCRLGHWGPIDDDE